MEQSPQELQKQILELDRLMSINFETFTQNAYEYLGLILNSSFQTELIAHLITNFSARDNRIPSSMPVAQFISEEEYEQFEREYVTEISKKVFQLAVQKGVSSFDIAKQILEMLNGKNMKEKVYFLSHILRSVLCPYKELPPGIKLSEKQYRDILLRPKFQESMVKLTQIQNGIYETRAELYTALGSILEEHDDKIERAFLLGVLAEWSSKKSKGLLQQIMGCDGDCEKCKTHEETSCRTIQ